jgi:hypothetical protein
MKYNQILYPSKSSTLDDLIYFSNWGMIFPTHQSNPVYLDDEEKYASVDNLNDNWTYSINKYGFRGSWPLDPTKKKIGFFGCSFTLGQGVEEKYTFPYLVEQHYNQKIESLNFGTSGASVQRIAKIISALSNIIKFETVVITLPPTSRLSYIHKVGMLSDLLPSAISSKEQSLYNILTQNDFDMYAVDAIQWITAELKGTNILWSSWCPNTYKILQEFADEKLLLPPFPLNDKKARDNRHPGKNCHELYSKMITEKLGYL